MDKIFINYARHCNGPEDPRIGTCVYDSSSYFPVIKPNPPACGCPSPSGSQQVKYRSDQHLVSCNNCANSDRYTCQEGCFCQGPEDCPPGKVCDMVTNQCVDPGSRPMYRMGDGNIPVADLGGDADPIMTTDQLIKEQFKNCDEWKPKPSPPAPSAAVVGKGHKKKHDNDTRNMILLGVGWIIILFILGWGFNKLI